MQKPEKCCNISSRDLTPENIAVINAALAQDQRVELIPTRDGVRVIRVRREEIKPRSKR